MSQDGLRIVSASFTIVSRLSVSFPDCFFISTLPVVFHSSHPSRAGTGTLCLLLPLLSSWLLKLVENDSEHLSTPGSLFTHRFQHEQIMWPYQAEKVHIGLCPNFQLARKLEGKGTVNGIQYHHLNNAYFQRVNSNREV